ncbi:DUF2889 domain-containing protein [Mycobacterium avium]|uniref:DUF2889 domain-containing protein n=1 Tax=Mycobacterium avium (strain 104) TaxID=243243 RepID=A0A0H2ZTP8_MYCA1|nr:DUF2889 domain-containing protein [Mycobacterium avium]ABK65094.1 conserved hypothetical protein [Mycobacterium avium 104]KDP08939.1 hypothetical protein MAV101_02450 [Mycobacterium avium subsp. hominissuis 101]
MRRNTSIDMTRSPGALDPLYLCGTGRDLQTAADGAAQELRHVGLMATVEMVAGVIRNIETDPPIDGMSRLAGAPAMSGFRAAADAVAPELRQRRDPLYTLIDDIPVATLISGHALCASGALGERSGAGYRPMIGQCAGFAPDGLMVSSHQAGEIPVVTGPIAPPLESPQDPIAWHQLDDLPLHGMRRRRRIDVSLSSGSEILVDAMFRDSYMRADAQETVIHEYTLTATVDADTGVILESRAVARVLPWQECPGAVESAARITGMTLAELHFRVRAELTGTSTCTHLNDLLRSVADAMALIPVVQGLR